MARGKQDATHDRKTIRGEDTGFGDAVIVSSIVKKAYAKLGKPVVVGNGSKIEWSEVFEHNPKIAKEIYPNCPWVLEVKGNRPYIDYSRTTKSRQYYRPYKVEPGEIVFTEAEKEKHKTRDFVYIEPNCKGSYSGNKDWGFENWQRVVDALPDIRFVQGSGTRLGRVEQVRTKTFRDACGLLLHADLFVGTDGGLHHAAAALGKKGIVVWGGLVGPDIMGYDFHKNLWSGVKSCGNVLPCTHCKDALASITPEMVIEAICSLR